MTDIQIPWDQYANSETYQSLPSKSKMAVRLGWFEDNIAHTPEFQAKAEDDQIKILEGFFAWEPDKPESKTPELTLGRLGHQIIARFGQGIENLARGEKVLRGEPELVAESEYPTHQPDFEEGAFLKGLYDRPGLRKKLKDDPHYQKREKAIGELKTVSEYFPEVLPGSSGIIEEGIAGAAEFGPAMLGQAVNPAIGAGAIFETIVGSKHEEYTNQGIDDERATRLAIVNAALTTPIEFAGNVLQFKFLGKIANKFASKTGGKIAAFVAEFLKIGVTEGGEEFLQTPPDEIINIIAANPDLSAKEIVKEVWVKKGEIGKRGVHGFKAGFVGGVALAGAGGVVMTPALLANYKTEKQIEIDKKRELGDVPDVTPIVDKIQADLDSGDITPEWLTEERQKLADDDPIARAMDSVLKPAEAPIDEEAYWKEQEAEIKRQREAPPAELVEPVSEMTRDEYDQWRLDQLNQRTGKDLSTELLTDEELEKRTGSKAGGGFVGTGILKRKGQPGRRGAFTHEILHAIDSVKNSQLQWYLENTLERGDTIAQGKYGFLKAWLDKGRKEGRLNPGNKTDNAVEVAQSVLDAYYRDKAGFKRSFPEIVKLLDDAGYGEFTDLSTPYHERKKTERLAALAEEEEVEPAVDRSYKARIEAQKNIRLEEAKEVAAENADLIGLIDRVASIQQTPISAPDQGPGKVQTKAALEPDVNKFLRRVEDHLVGEIPIVEGKGRGIPFAQTLDDMTDEDVKEAVKLINPILEATTEQMKLKKARDAIDENPLLFSVIQGLIGKQDAESIREGEKPLEEEGAVPERVEEEGRDVVQQEGEKEGAKARDEELPQKLPEKGIKPTVPREKVGAKPLEKLTKEEIDALPDEERVRLVLPEATAEDVKKTAEAAKKVREDLAKRTVAFDDLPDYAKGAIASDARTKNLPAESFTESTWKKKIIDVDKLHQENITKDFIYRGSRTEGSIIVNNDGKVIDGYNRLFEAKRDGQKNIEVLSRADKVEDVADKLVDEKPEAAKVEKPPINEADYLTELELAKEYRGNYFDEQGKKIALSREKPAKIRDLPIGSWKIDDFKGIHGREISQLRLVDPDNLIDVEDPEKYRKSDVKRYELWLKEGKSPPPIEVVETITGKLKITDGHRRAAAAKRSGEKVPAWVSPVANHPEGLKDASTGRVQKVGLTFEMLKPAPEAEKEIARKVEGVEKPKPIGRAWIKNKWSPIMATQEIKRGKNEGKVWVTLPNKNRKMVEADAVRLTEEKPSERSEIDVNQWVDTELQDIVTQDPQIVSFKTTKQAKLKSELDKRAKKQGIPQNFVDTAFAESKWFKSLTSGDRELTEQLLGMKKGEFAKVAKPKKPRTLPLEDVKNLRSAIKKLGGIRWGKSFKGERRDIAGGIKRALFRERDGMPWDTIEKELRDVGWLDADENLIEAIQTKDRLLEGRRTKDIGEKKESELTEKDRKFKKELEREPEAPPEGKYVVMEAEDLPMNKKLTIIEDKTREGWDVYTVQEKDPFGITLKNGQTIELKPGDKVQVLKKDLPEQEKQLPSIIAPPKETNYYPYKTKSAAIENDFNRWVTETDKDPLAYKYNKKRSSDLKIDAGYNVPLSPDEAFKQLEMWDKNVKSNAGRLQRGGKAGFNISPTETLKTQWMADKLRTVINQWRKDYPVGWKKAIKKEKPTLELEGEQAMPPKQAALRAKKRTQSAGRQESLGLIEPAPKGEWLKGEQVSKKEAVGFKKQTEKVPFSISKGGLEGIVKKWRDKGVDLYVYERDTILLDTFIVPKNQRRRGVGSDVMADLVNYSDSVGKKIVLSPATKKDNFGTTSKGRLVKFYKRFGFVENKGRNKDYRTRYQMYRRPEPQAQFSLAVSSKDYSRITNEIDGKVGKKYDDILDLPEVPHQPGVFGSALEGIDEGSTTPNDLKNILQNIKNSDTKQYRKASEQAKSVIADQIGELIGTYKYVGFKDAQKQERYIDSLLKAVSEVEVQDTDTTASVKEAETPERIFSDRRIAKQLPLFSLGPSPATNLTKESLEKAIAPITAKWQNKPRIIPVHSQLELPETLKKQAVLRGLQGRIQGVIHRGKVYLVARNIKSEEEAVKVLLHEVAGHWGLRQALSGDREYVRTIGQIYISNKAEIGNAVKNYDFDLSMPQDVQMATEEWLAQMAESSPENTFVQKVVSAIRKALRRLFPNLKWSDAEITALLTKARERVQYEGKKPTIKAFAPYFGIGGPAEVFYSQMQNVLAKKLPNKGTPQSMKQTIESFANKGEFKKEELEWSGVEDWLTSLLESKDAKPTGRTTENVKKDDWYSHIYTFKDGIRVGANSEAEAIKEYNIEKYGEQPIWSPLRILANGKITKQQVLDYLETNNVGIEEIVKGVSISDEWKKTEQRLLNKAVQLMPEGGSHPEKVEVITDYAQSRDAHALKDYYGLEASPELMIALENYWEHYNSEDRKLIERFGPTKFSQYTQPGGSGYKELLMTLPELEYTSSHWDERGVLVHVRFDTRTSFDSPPSFVESKSKESASNRLSADADLLSNVVESEPFISKGFGGLDVEVQSSVVSSMVSAVGNEKVLRGVIESIPVNVMNKLIRAEFSPENFFSNKTMLSDSFSGNPNAAVRFSPSSVGTLVRSTANLATKESDRSSKTVRLPIQRGVTPGASDIISSHKEYHTLHISEIQSDIHQEGRKKGYATGKVTELPEGSKIHKPGETADNPKGWMVELPHGAVRGRTNFFGLTENVAIKNALDWLSNDPRDTVPQAPFKKTWPMLAIKRMVRYAAENDFDAISWDTGEVQAERYDLSQQVEAVGVDRNPDGTYDIIAQTPDHKMHDIKKGVQEKDIADYIGKDLAEKVVKNKKTNQIYEGADLKVGGEGMKSFYDKLLVNEVNKFFGKKAWGKARVGVGKISSEQEEWAVYNAIDFEKTFPNEEAAQNWGEDISRGLIEEPDGDWYLAATGKYLDQAEVWQLPITPEMKSKVLQEGLPQFKVEDRAAFSLTKDEQKTYLDRLKDTKEYQDYKESLGRQSPKQIVESGEAKSLFQRVKDNYKKPYIDQDMKWYSRAFENPASLAKKYISMKKAFDTELTGAETRSSELFLDYEGELGSLQEKFTKWSKSQKQEFNKLIWKWDGAKFPKNQVPTDWAENVGDIEKDIEINPKHYDEVRSMLERQGVSTEIVEGFLTIRKKLDEKWIEADALMRQDIQDPETIKEFRGVINRLPNYFPHRRVGNVHVSVSDKDGDLVYREHFNSFRERWLRKPANKARQRAKQWVQGQISAGKLSGNVNDYRINVDKVTKLPDEVFFQIPIEAMQQVIATAGQKLAKSRVEYEAQRLFKKGAFGTIEEARKKIDTQLRTDFEEKLSMAIADTFKARGWAGHAISRRSGKGVPGHETEDIFGVLFDYLSGFAGFKTKIQRAKEHRKTLKDIDAKKNPDEYRYVSNYVKDMLANQDKVDRAVDTVRGLFFVKYLGFVVKSGFVNLTQNAVLAAPVLSIHTKSADRKLAKAMKDVRRGLTSKAAWTGQEVKYRLSENEQNALHQLIESGASIDQFLREMKGNMPGVGWGKHFKKVVNTAGIFMSVAEKFNRASTGLAGYRVGLENGLSDGEAIEFAKQVIYDSHFVYGKHNLPSSMRGGAVRKYLRSAYTFRSFSHNYVLTLVHMIKNQGAPGRKAAARSLRNIILIGGLTSFPFFKVLAEGLMWALGDDDEDAMTNIRGWFASDWLKDLVTYGIAGGAGVDVTGSMSIEVPRDWKDIIGVPYAILEDSMNSIDSLKSGQTFRALSETPFTPMVARNAMRGFELFTKGQRTRSGRDINVPGKVGPRKITGAEAVGKAVLGFQPTAMSKGYAGYRARSKAADVLNAKKKRFADRYVNAMKQYDYPEMQQVLGEVMQWNQGVIEQGKTHMVINIKSMIQSRLKPGIKSIPKQMRVNALRVGQQWQ